MKPVLHLFGLGNGQVLVVNILLMAAYLILSATIIFQFAILEVQNDFAGHIGFVEDGTRLTYPVWHWSILGVAAMTGMSLQMAALVSTTCMAFVTFLATHLLLVKTTPGGTINTLLPAFSLCIVAAIYIPFVTENMYFGVGTPNVWHNPTNYPVYFLQLISFYFIVRYLELVKSIDLFISATLIGISLLAKPTFGSTILPALFIWIALYEQGKRLRKLTLPLLSGLAAAIVIVPQLINLWGAENERGAGLTIAPFTVWAYWTESILLAIVRALLFPMLTLIAVWRFSDKPINRFFGLTWINILVGIAIYVLVAESYDGHIATDGNFAWGYYLAMPPLFISAFAQWRTLNYALPRKWNWALWTALGLHFTFGVVYLLKILSTGSIA